MDLDLEYEQDRAEGRRLHDELSRYWEHRKNETLAAAVDRNAAERLLTKIYAWSRRQKQWGDNAGRWVTDMQYTCWSACRSLRQLARLAGGWWWWSDGVVFIAYDEWIRVFHAWSRCRMAEKDARIARAQLKRILPPPEEGHRRFEEWSGGTE